MTSILSWMQQTQERLDAQLQAEKDLQAASRKEVMSPSSQLSPSSSSSSSSSSAEASPKHKKFTEAEIIKMLGPENFEIGYYKFNLEVNGCYKNVDIAKHLSRKQPFFQLHEIDVEQIYTSLDWDDMMEDRTNPKFSEMKQKLDAVQENDGIVWLWQDHDMTDEELYYVVGSYVSLYRAFTQGKDYVQAILVTDEDFLMIKREKDKKEEIVVPVKRKPGRPPKNKAKEDSSTSVAQEEDGNDATDDDGKDLVFTTRRNINRKRKAEEPQQLKSLSHRQIVVDQQGIEKKRRRDIETNGMIVDHKRKLHQVYEELKQIVYTSANLDDSQQLDHFYVHIPSNTISYTNVTKYAESFILNRPFGEDGIIAVIHLLFKQPGAQRPPAILYIYHFQEDVADGLKKVDFDLSYLCGPSPYLYVSLLAPKYYQGVGDDVEIEEEEKKHDPSLETGGGGKGTLKLSGKARQFPSTLEALKIEYQSMFDLAMSNFVEPGLSDMKYGVQRALQLLGGKGLPWGTIINCHEKAGHKGTYVKVLSILMDIVEFGKWSLSDIVSHQ